VSFSAACGAHLVEVDVATAFCCLECCFGAGEAAADDLDALGQFDSLMAGDSVAAVGEIRGFFASLRMTPVDCEARVMRASPETCMPFHSDFMTAPREW